MADLPDDGCFTVGDGSCVGGPCMHNDSDLVRYASSAWDARRDEIRANAPDGAKVVVISPSPAGAPVYFTTVEEAVAMWSKIQGAVIKDLWAPERTPVVTRNMIPRPPKPTDGEIAAATEEVMFAVSEGLFPAGVLVIPETLKIDRSALLDFFIEQAKEAGVPAGVDASKVVPLVVVHQEP